MSSASLKRNQLHRLVNSLSETASQCEKCALHNICLPSGLDKEDLEHLTEIIHSSKTVPKGHVLFRAGEPFDALYVVHAGVFKSAVADDSGKEKIIQFNLPGEVVGLDGIYDARYQTTVTALSSGSYCKIPFNELLQAAQSYPELQKQLLRLMSKNLNHCERTHGELSAPAKLASFVLSLAGRFKERGFSPLEFDLPISQRDMANFLGMAEETLSRQFKKLQQQNILEYKRHHLKILDMPRLQAIAHNG
jgi:CRP/FNR family transcriptional regulator